MEWLDRLLNPKMEENLLKKWLTEVPSEQEVERETKQCRKEALTKSSPVMPSSRFHSRSISAPFPPPLDFSDEETDTEFKGDRNSF